VERYCLLERDVLSILAGISKDVVLLQGSNILQGHKRENII
jgi:hypothetical protein